MRRYVGMLFVAFLTLATYSFADNLPKMEVYKSVTCGCCSSWVVYLRNNGFDVHVSPVRDVTPHRVRAKIPEALGSCHTAFVGGYAIEGHVPAADIKRLLNEKPKAIGLAVPGMVQSSPGMEQGQGSQPYNVLLIGLDGKTSVYSRH